MTDKVSILRLPEVLDRTGLSRSSWYAAMNEGKAPKPISILGGRAKGWSSKVIDEWIESVLEVAA